MTDPNPLPWIQPAPPPADDAIAHHFLAHEFRQEVEHREAIEAYYTWYQAIADQNRRDLAAMRQEPNFFRWFGGKG
ncbi:MAG: hypothetical protein ACO4AI_11895 [Prochlorothrix sp.]|nr:hypothetical protein [Prochlorothrix sp.]